MSRRWLEERRRDYYWRLAKEEGYRSRAAFKLLQANKSYRFIKPGDVVVDLGAAPGGWMQSARKLVGDQGYVLGVDILPIKPFKWPNVETLESDITHPDVVSKIREKMPRAADVVLCDLSPQISGVWEVDHARQIDLATHALKIAVAILQPEGAFFTKVFQGDLLDNFIREIKRSFREVRIVKPEASKRRSAEIYILGVGLSF